MKTIGLIGGMSWESSLEYYRIINETIKAKLGGLHSAECVMHSVDFAPIEKLQRQGRWQESARPLVAAAQSVERAGADFVVLCTNTMHKFADEIQANIGIPFLHIADATAQKVRAFLAKEPELRDALKLFDMSMKQYAQALSHLNRPQIVTTASSTPV